MLHFAFFKPKEHFMLLLISFVISCSVFSSCMRRGGSSAPTPTSSTEQQVQATSEETSTAPKAVQVNQNAAQPKINIFIENSGSMNGFINSASGFQDAIQKMMVLLKYYYNAENIKLNYINTAVHPQQVPAKVQIEDFAVSMLSPNRFRRVGNVHSTDLNDIVKMILKGVDENSVAILVSDCIYSIVGNGTTETLLTGCKNKTMGAFLEKTKEYPDLATIIVRLSSHFSGHYWDCKHPSGQQYHTLDCDRPYYICVIGTDANIKVFNEHINVDQMRGYENKYVLSSNDYSECNYSALTRTHNMAMFRVKGSGPFKTLERARSHGNQFQFAIAADLSALPMSNAEKLDRRNYDVISGQYSITGVSVVDPIHMHPIDKQLVEEFNLTHEIIVSTNQYPSDITVGVKRDIPQWVKNANSIDDTQIDNIDSEKVKTFGLEYFVQGISEAFKEVASDKDYITKFTIQVMH